jgi:hypothetical protein
MERPDRMRLDWLITDFPKELHAICCLVPLRSSANLIPFLTQLTAIIYLFRAKYESVPVAKKVGRELEKGAGNLERAIQDFRRMNYFVLGAALPEVSEKSPRLKGLDATQVLELLDEYQVFLNALNDAVRTTADVALVPRKRGDKTAYHFVPTLPLMELWESILATQQDRAARRQGRGVPTPKRVTEVAQSKNKLTFISKQPSTEFIRIALRMIDPTITDAQVFTAIKVARSKRNSLYAMAGVRNFFGFDEALGARK